MATRESNNLLFCFIKLFCKSIASTVQQRTLTKFPCPSTYHFIPNILYFVRAWAHRKNHNVYLRLFALCPVLRGLQILTPFPMIHHTAYTYSSHHRLHIPTSYTFTWPLIKRIKIKIVNCPKTLSTPVLKWTSIDWHQIFLAILSIGMLICFIFIS